MITIRKGQNFLKQNGREWIPIEEREGEELRQVRGVQVAPTGVKAFNPVFDVTPASLIDVIVTEKGVVSTPNLTGMAGLFS